MWPLGFPPRLLLRGTAGARLVLERNGSKITTFYPGDFSMKRISLCLFLIVAIGVMNHAQAQFRTPDVAWGLSLGGAQGDNSGSDKWVMQYRGFLQVDVMHDYLVGQVGLGFTELYAPNVYSSATGMADVRLLFSPTWPTR